MANIRIMKTIFIKIILITNITIIACSIERKNYSSNKIGDEFLDKCTDSINNISINTNEPPKFLFDPCFDDKPAYWLDLHQPISLRKKVLDKVKNKKAIEFLLKNYRDQLSNKCIMLTDSIYYCCTPIPLIEKSFYDLLSMRLTELN